MRANILVIENSVFEAKQLKALLGTFGHGAVVAETGREGMHLAVEKKPDLIFVDLSLRDVSAIEICRWAKLNPETREIPIIVLGGRTEIQARISCMEEGASDIVSKPVDDLEIKARVAAVLREKSLRGALCEKEQEYEALLSNIQSGAIYDPVTGLLSKDHYERVLSKAFDEVGQSKQPLACLMIEVDQFKKVRSSSTQEVTEEVLRTIARVIQKQIRGADTAARYSEDCFAVLLKKQGSGEAEKIAARIIENINASSFGKSTKKSQGLSVNIGIASVPDPEIHQVSQVLECVHFALDKSKKANGSVQSAEMRELMAKADSRKDKKTVSLVTPIKTAK